MIRGRPSKAREVPVEGELENQEGVARLCLEMFTALSARCDLGRVSENERRSSGLRGSNADPPSARITLAPPKQAPSPAPSERAHSRASNGTSLASDT